MARSQADGALGLTGATAGEALGITLDAAAADGGPVIIPDKINREFYV